MELYQDPAICLIKPMSDLEFLKNGKVKEGMPRLILVLEFLFIRSIWDKQDQGL